MWNNYEPFDPKILQELREKQINLQRQIELRPLQHKIKLIAGCDSSIINQEKIFSIFVIFKYPTLEEIEVEHQTSELTLPYIPGYLAFREIPNLLKAYDLLKNKPDVIMVDGHGIAHPRGLGIASHLGALLKIPTIGIAKKVLVGNFKMPEREKGSYTNLIYKDNEIGYALRSKDKVKPIFVSPGNLITAEESLQITLNTLKNHKLPEPTRIADLYSKKLKPQIEPYHPNII
jgi:deoxyribonuclease V